jgi:cation diffusion facilitator CzcD-associated flavoprotein CzcO
MTTFNIAIIGAGPYGLSIAAHLRAHGVDHRIFGRAMEFWQSHMPEGMLLKSEGFASSLSDPGGEFTLERYCREAGLPYADVGLPTPLSTFTSYGLEFQKRFVPQFENKRIVSLNRTPKGYEIRLTDGEILTTRKVVVATGLSYYEHIPPVLAELSDEYVTHSSSHSELAQFKGREIAVVGAGASAMDLAALLHQAGALVQVIARNSTVAFQDPPVQGGRSLWSRLRFPRTGIGNGWNVFWCSSLPQVFRHMPEHFRLDKVRRILGPAPGWFTKEQVVGKVPFNLGVAISRATVENGRVHLELAGSDGARRMLVTDHVIAATGYRVDLRRLGFMNRDVLEGIRSVENTPVLSSNFESSVPGLYFVGVTAANTFGPLLRFAFGTRFVARRLSRHLARSNSR